MIYVETMGGCTSVPEVATGSLTLVENPDAVKAKCLAPLDFTIDRTTNQKITNVARKRGI